MSGRGRRAALPAGSHARPEYLVADGHGGQVVRHYNREGRVREYDFASLPVPASMQASLAALFAARCTPGRWSAHDSSEGSWLQLRRVHSGHHPRLAHLHEALASPAVCYIGALTGASRRQVEWFAPARD